jgi:hypothetical protein
MWLAEELIGSFPNALFLGIQRNPYATVASMMAHKGVSAWHKRWKEFPVLNRFLGLTENAVEGYDDLSLAAQCAMRWLSHQQRMQQLRGVLGRALMVIEYEDLARVPQEIVLTLARFLELREPIDTPYVKTESLYKWRAQLTPADIRDIFTVTGSPPDNDVGTGVSMSNLLVSTSASQKH